MTTLNATEDELGTDSIVQWIEGFGMGLLGQTGFGVGEEVLSGTETAAETAVTAASEAANDALGRFNAFSVGAVETVTSVLHWAKIAGIVIAVLAGMAIIAWLVSSVAKVVA